jgi:hypothetical protein
LRVAGTIPCHGSDHTHGSAARVPDDRPALEICK